MGLHCTSRTLFAAALIFAFQILPSSRDVNSQVSQSNPSMPSAPSNATAHPVLVELFTSEGCSSCPPADALVEKMDSAQPIPGAQLIVLSEHVDYWDHDGWKDPNSSPAMTERQVSYVRALGLSTPYTPQIIVDGTREVSANDPKLVEKTLREAANESEVPVNIGEVDAEPGNPLLLRAHVEAVGNSLSRNADLYVAVTLNRVDSQVLRGENGGRHLTHVAVVQQLIKVGKLTKGKTFSQDVQLKLKPGTDPANVRIVAFVQEPGPGKVVGATLWKHKVQ